jgi:hypothetical protein
LDEAVQWAGEHDAELIRDEPELLKASLDVRQREEETAALAERQRKLEAAERLVAAERLRAEEQEQAAKQLRARNRIIQYLGIAALLLMVLAIAGFISAQNQAQVAQKNESIALRRQREAVESKATADAALATAEAAAQEFKA